MIRPKEIVLIVYSYLVGVVFGIMDVALIGVITAAIISIINSTKILSGLPFSVTIYKTILRSGDIVSHVMIALLIYPMLLPLIIRHRFMSLISVGLSVIYVRIALDLVYFGSWWFHYFYLLDFMFIFLSICAVTISMRNIERLVVQWKKGIDRQSIIRLVMTLFILSVGLPISVMLLFAYYVGGGSPLLIIGRTLISPVESVIYFIRANPIAFFAPIPVIGILYYAGHSLYKRLRDRPSLHV